MKTASLHASLTLIAAMLLSACAAMQQTDDEVVIRQPGDRFLGPPQPVQPEAINDLEFAWLSEGAYDNTPAGQDDKLAVAAAPSAAGECPVPQDELRARNWHVWPGFPNDGLQAKIDKYHLRAEIWYRQDPPAVAVAFGGTVLNSRNDWVSNLRWFLPAHKDEYSETVQDLAPAFVKEYEARLQSGDADWQFLKDAKLYATGHSLGGGLAQQFAYALPIDSLMPRVAHVYAFDPSPVTGYYSVTKSVRETNSETLAIDRIYERGEILALVRSLTSVVVAPSLSEPTIRGVRYSLFYPSGPIAGHSIKQLACKLREAAMTPAPDGTRFGQQ